VDTTETITHLSLCSGYEGIGLGLRRVLPNLREIAYVEREGFPVANLVAKMEAGHLDAAPIFTDVKTFPYGKFRGKVDILSGGFPCQPFSQAGKRKATDDPRHLFPFIAEGIRECQPTIVLLENVEGILSSRTGDGEPVLQYVLRTLEDLGYRATAGIFSAREVGATHQRKRVFILGMANGERSRLRRGRSSEERGDDTERLQGNEGERHELRGEAAGCGDTSRDELANTKNEGLQGRNESPEGNPQGRQAQAGQHTTVSSNRDLWVSRPNEPQHEWEEPRVIESELGRTTDGSSSRVDRLRLLGNAVVPATVAKAFVTLIQRLV